MDLQTALLYTILSTVVGGAVAPTDPADAGGGATVGTVERALPEDARRGRLYPPRGDGLVVIDEQVFRLAPGAQIRNQQNLLVVPMQIVDAVEVLYLTDASGAINRVWLLTSREARMSRAR